MTKSTGTKQVSIRLTQEQADTLSEKAAKLGLTKPGYLKHLALSQPVKVKNVTIQKRFDDETARTLRGIGTNLNQIAWAENLARMAGKSADVWDALKEAQASLAKIAGDTSEPDASKQPLKDRLALAEAGEDQDLDLLVSDPVDLVRAAVADQGRDQDLDILVSDPAWQVRAAVALQGRDRDAQRLWQDPAWQVRRAVAVSGCGQSAVIEAALASDPDPRVRRAADPLSWIDWEDDAGLDRLTGSPVGIVRAAVADQGRDKDLDRLVRDPAWQVRAAVAFQGRDKDLDRLVRDPDPRVRAAVAMQGRDKDLDRLVSDPDSGVREAVSGHAN